MQECLLLFKYEYIVFVSAIRFIYYNLKHNNNVNVNYFLVGFLKIVFGDKVCLYK